MKNPKMAKWLSARVRYSLQEALRKREGEGGMIAKILIRLKLR